MGNTQGDWAVYELFVGGSMSVTLSLAAMKIYQWKFTKSPPESQPNQVFLSDILLATAGIASMLAVVRFMNVMEYDMQVYFNLFCVASFFSSASLWSIRFGLVEKPSWFYFISFLLAIGITVAVAQSFATWRLGSPWYWYSVALTYLAVVVYVTLRAIGLEGSRWATEQGS